MRIVKGMWSGQHLRFSNNAPGLRPTSNFAKEGILNVVEHRYGIEGKRVLDLCAGIGSLSFEFLSMRAKWVCMVEHSSAQCVFLKNMLEKLDAPSTSFQIVQSDIFAYMNTTTHRQFDIAFADPPFKEHWQDKIINHLLANSLLAEGGLFIYEQHKRMHTESIRQTSRNYTYGDIQFNLFERKGIAQ